MFIGWLQYADAAELIKIAEETGLLLDNYHVKLIMMHAPHLCYGAYDDGVLVGAIVAIPYERSAMIKYFMVRPSHQRKGIGRRLFETLFGVLKDERLSLYLHSSPQMRSFFEGYGFKTQMEVGRFLNVGKVPPFSFTNAQAKELDGGNFDAAFRRIDYETFQEDRMEFLADEMERNSSLKFVLPNAFQHSSVINARGVYLGPWQCREGSEDEAEKMMRGVLYFRGLKKVMADVPMGNKHAVDLYERYHFQQKGTFSHMTYGEPRNVRFENIYAFSL
ncbi:GNAT family N-acetyltransferase [Sulfuricurvum sp.]|uniref:GNAT family N-acetyltransferase n=1 Tax=Sulfuricurvum sp. TaxID=2025608 RepID=UPI00260ED248|nr:GNAT family N-acetyltransferase [Sulfuricurvum sp.]MDD3597259.1 GNAT family N-acetyltransferase [Sulfuricurvum sp.]